MGDPAGMRRSRPAGKPRHRQIEAAPEEMHGTAFATKMRAELLEHAIALHQNAPEPISVLRVIRAMRFVLIEWDRVLNLVRHFVNRYWQMKLVESPDDSCVHMCNRTRQEFHRSSLAKF